MSTALSWCIEAGVTAKMVRETQVVMRKAGFKGSYWVKPRNLGHQKLYFIHISPAIFLCVYGLCTATLLFISEMIYHRCRVTDQTTKVTVERNARPSMKNEEPKPLDGMPVIEV